MAGVVASWAAYRALAAQRNNFGSLKYSAVEDGYTMLVVVATMHGHDGYLSKL